MQSIRWMPTLLGTLCLVSTPFAWSGPGVIEPVEGALIDTTAATDVAPLAETDRLIADAKSDALRDLTVLLEREIERSKRARS